MSWSIHVPETTLNTLGDDARAAYQRSVDATAETNGGEVPPWKSEVSAEEQQQLEAAISAAPQLLASIGASARHQRFALTVHGHTNPGHEPRDGYAEDEVSVSVRLLAA